MYHLERAPCDRDRSERTGELPVLAQCREVQQAIRAVRDSDITMSVHHTGIVGVSRDPTVPIASNIARIDQSGRRAGRAARCPHGRWALRDNNRASRPSGRIIPVNVKRPRGRSSMAESQPSKLVMPVRSRSPALSNCKSFTWSVALSRLTTIYRRCPERPPITRPFAPRSRPDRARPYAPSGLPCRLYRTSAA